MEKALLACLHFQAEEALSHKELVQTIQCLRHLLDYAQEGILTIDEEEVIHFANRRVCLWLNRTEEETIGKRLSDFFHDIDLEIVRNLWDILKMGLEPIRPTLEMTLDGSKYMNAEVDVVSVADDPANDTMVHLVIRDRTERVRTEEALRNGNAFFKKLLDSTVDGIIAADTKGNIILFNQGAEHLIGYTQNEAVSNLHVSCLYPEGEAKRIMQMLRGNQFGGTGKCYKQRIVGVTKDGREIPLSLSGSIIYDEDGNETASVGVFTDLSQIDSMHQELQQQEQALFACEKLSSIGKLAAGVAHEINNPLTGILTFAEDLLEESDPDDPRREDYSLILRETMRCREIVRNLLDFGRQQPPKRIPSDINEIILHAVRLVSRLPGFHNNDLQCKLQPGLPPVVCDSTQIQQILINLFVNSAEAMPNGGEIRITSLNLPKKKRVELQVSDTGSGMPPEVIDNIFEPFYSTKGGKTNGLGLSVAWGIVDRHGGDIRVESKLGKGTTFYIELPSIYQEQSGREQAS